MKKITNIIIPVLVICFTTSLFSQQSNKDFFAKKHEINLGAANLFANNQNNTNTYYYYPYYGINSMMPYPYYSTVHIPKMPAIGVGYKYHFKKNAIRAKINFSADNSETTYDTNTSPYTSKNQNLWYEVKLGYERQINFQRTQFFYGMDCLYNVWNYSNEYKNYSNWNKSEYNNNSYGVSPFIGVKVFITPMLSLSAETNFEYEEYKAETKNSYSSSPESVSEEKGNSSNFGPIGLISINIHL